MASGFCSESQTGAGPAIRPRHSLLSAGRRGRLALSCQLGISSGSGSVAPAPSYLLMWGQASLGSLSVPPDQLPGRERGSSSACPRATSQSSALLVRQDAQGLLLLPLQEEIFLPPKYVSHQSLGSC